jgi:small subunit ribosomal protein S7
MRNGNKSLSDRLVKNVLLNIRLQGLSPSKILTLAVLNTSPVVSVKNVRSRGKTFKVPFPLSPKQQLSKSFDILLKNTDLSSEALTKALLDASNNRGKSVKDRRTIHQIARDNRTFSNYRWF